MPGIELYPGQARAFRARCRELLIDADPLAGTSHLLRAMAVLRALQRPGTVVQLAAPKGTPLRERYLEGPGGLWEMLEPVAVAGGARWQGGMVILANGSSIQLAPWDALPRRVPDVLLIDDAAGLGLHGYGPLRERILTRRPPSASGSVASCRTSSGTGMSS